MAITWYSLTPSVRRLSKPRTSPGTALRILRQCEAARAVIAEFLRLDAFGDLSGRAVAETALKQLASVHSDHADFEEAWL